MKYELKQVNNPTQRSYGKYVAKAVHYNTISAKQLCETMQANCTVKESDILAVLTELQDTIQYYLKQGYKVELPAIGTMKLEIKSTAVDAPEDFNVTKHVNGFSLHVLPKCRNGIPEIYTNVKLEKQ